MSLSSIRRSIAGLSLALAVSLGSGALGAPVALACGGYSVVSPEDRAAIEDAVGRHFFDRFDDPMMVSTWIELDGDRADVWATFEDGTTEFATVLREGSGWRVVE